MAYFNGNSRPQEHVNPNLCSSELRLFLEREKMETSPFGSLVMNLLGL